MEHAANHPPGLKVAAVTKKITYARELSCGDDAIADFPEIHIRNKSGER